MTINAVISRAFGAGLVCAMSVFTFQTVADATDQASDKPASVTPGMLNETWSVDWWEPRHKAKLKEAAEREIDLVMIGDSITHGWEEAGAEIWDKYYADRQALNLGFSGDRTENVLWRIEHGAVDGLEPELAVVMIGTNNTGHREDPPENTALGVQSIIKELQTRLPETEILLLAVFPRGATADDELRQINAGVNDELKKLAGEGVTFLDINENFLDAEQNLPESIMPDLLHPNSKGYRIWAEAMEPTLAKMLGEEEVEVPSKDE